MTSPRFEIFFKKNLDVLCFSVGWCYQSIQKVMQSELMIETIVLVSWYSCKTGTN